MTLPSTAHYTLIDRRKDKWTPYKFTKNVYDIWMPTHLKTIYSIINKLPPDLDFKASKQSQPRESKKVLRKL
jgi:hypothetical protein